MAQCVGVCAVPDDRAEDDEIRDGARATRREMPGAPLAQDGAEQGDGDSPGEHLHRRSHVRARMSRILTSKQRTMRTERPHTRYGSWTTRDSLHSSKGT